MSNRNVANGALVEEYLAFNWRIELQGSTNVAELETELQKKSYLTDVDVCVHESVNGISSTRLSSFFGKLGGSLNGLRRLEFFPGVGGHNVIPIAALCEALRGSRKLESLYVYHLELQGDTLMFQSFASQLEQCHLLKEVCFIDCRISSNQEGSGMAFDPVVRCLRTLKSLKVVALWADDLGVLATESLSKLCQSSSIERLMIQGFQISDSDVASMLCELEKNDNLKRLNISCSLGNTSCQALAQMLQRNTKLEKLQVDIDAFDNEGDLAEVARGLRHNSTLNYLKLSGPDCDCDNDGVLGAFESMLESNLSLQTLSILDGTVYSSKMAFYLKLNSCGRGHIFQAGIAKRDPWLDALLKSEGDIDCLFYFLSLTDRVSLVNFGIK